MWNVRLFKSLLDYGKKRIEFIVLLFLPYFPSFPSSMLPFISLLSFHSHSQPHNLWRSKSFPLCTASEAVKLFLSVSCIFVRFLVLYLLGLSFSPIDFLQLISADWQARRKVKTEPNPRLVKVIQRSKAELKTHRTQNWFQRWSSGAAVAQELQSLSSVAVAPGTACHKGFPVRKKYHRLTRQQNAQTCLKYKSEHFHLLTERHWGRTSLRVLN